MSHIIMTKATFTDRWSSFFFSSLFFSLWVSDKEKSTSVTFSAYTYEVITLNEQILSPSLSLSPFFLSQYRRTSKRRRGMCVLLIVEQTSTSKKKRIRELTGNWTHTYKTGAFVWTNRFVLHKFLFLLSSHTHTQTLLTSIISISSMAYLKDYFYYWKTTNNKAFFPWF